MEKVVSGCLLEKVGGISLCKENSFLGQDGTSFGCLEEVSKLDVLAGKVVGGFYEFISKKGLIGCQRMFVGGPVSNFLEIGRAHV